MKRKKLSFKNITFIIFIWRLLTLALPLSFLPSTAISSTQVQADVMLLQDAESGREYPLLISNGR
ncbi:MAG: hypothetical protein HQK50_14455, partial [Oligoflexia bacterium]|nr:hypothetical protein [Oligoflexia bacterium]